MSCSPLISIDHINKNVVRKVVLMGSRLYDKTKEMEKFIKKGMKFL